MMLCPCCAARMQPGALECSCGARIVGHPLGETQFKVRRYGPVMIAVVAAAGITMLALVISSWLALGALLPILLARRALRLASREPELYGGYKTAGGTLALSLIASISLASYAIVRIPDYLEKREIRQRAAEQARGLHVASLLEQYRSEHLSYPKTLEPIRRMDGGFLPPEFWSKMINYTPNGQIAINSKGGEGGVGGMEFDNFELRLAGPDGIMGTADDIVMRDGIFYLSSEPVKPQPAKELLFH
jgi:hypothetical protein